MPFRCVVSILEADERLLKLANVRGAVVDVDAQSWPCGSSLNGREARSDGRRPARLRVASRPKNKSISSWNEISDSSMSEKL